MIDWGGISALVCAYLLGSIPSAVWIGKILYNLDVREFGSGNSGATNAFRVLGKKAGIAVLLIDVLKGWSAVNIAYIFDVSLFSQSYLMNFKLSLGVASLLGHIFPVYAGFRGGKGIATLLGLMIAIHPKAAIAALIVFLIVFLATRFVSLGSICAALSFPLILLFIYHETVSSLIIFSLFISILTLITHQKNIERLLKREESRARIRLNIKRSVHPDEDDEEMEE